MMESKPKKFAHVSINPPGFDAFDKYDARKRALGTSDKKEFIVVAELRSVNFKPGVSGFRVTPLGFELGNTSGLPSLLSTNISDFNEAAQDAVGNGFLDTATIDLTYDDTNGQFFADIVSAYKRKSLFDHFADMGNVGTGEDDLYSDTIAAGQLSANGQKLSAEYGGIFVSSATATRQIRIYFGGTLIFDTGALTLSLSSAWTAYVTITRVSAAVVRCMVSFATEGAALAAYTSYTEVTGLTLVNTQVLKITGEAAGVGAATNDIVAKLSNVEWLAAA